MPNVQKFPFEYILETTKPNSEVRASIETPWMDDDIPIIDQMERDEIYTSPDLSISEQKYDNGFHLMLINSGNKIVIKSNWELDYIENTNKYLPRIQ